MRSLSQSFYSQLPETTETQFTKSVSELQSEVRQKQHIHLCEDEDEDISSYSVI